MKARGAAALATAMSESENMRASERFLREKRRGRREKEREGLARRAARLKIVALSATEDTPVRLNDEEEMSATRQSHRGGGSEMGRASRCMLDKKSEKEVFGAQRGRRLLMHEPYGSDAGDNLRCPLCVIYAHKRDNEGTFLQGGLPVINP